MKYLYGAAVQGIQNFIFQTNKLAEIVGASELVEQICTTKFKEIMGSEYHEYDEASESGAVMHAAGNVKYLFTKKQDCEKVVRSFPRVIFNAAPGVTVSQAVVEYDGNFEKSVNLLESRLRTQRNIQMRSNMIGFMGIERSRQTGLPVVEVKSERRYGKDIVTYIDEGTRAKRENNSTNALCNKAFGFQVNNEQIPHNIEDLTRFNDWIAIVHIDGNGLGQVVQKVGINAFDFKKFSDKLDEATTESANEAFSALLSKNDFSKGKNVIPVRPIVLSGDDHTVIIRADLAIDYVRSFINAFENKTSEKLGDLLLKYNVFPKGSIHDRLTACAGISYIKSSYPFYYGYNLSEMLCSQSKKDAKANLAKGEEMPMSCLLFHKVQDSFVENWSQIRKRELTPCSGMSFEFGPYYLHDKDDRWTIDTLMREANKLHSDGNKDENAVKSHLRQWMSQLYDNQGMAEQTLNRMYSMLNDDLKLFAKRLSTGVVRGDIKCYPTLDVLSIHSINNQVTR